MDINKREATVLVTGISGFVASRCALHLLDQGYRVRGTLRSISRADSMRALLSSRVDPGDRLEFVEADLTDDGPWHAATQGCTDVLHVASPVPLHTPKDPNEVIVPARDGTLRVLSAAATNGVRRVVMTSSMAAVCYGHERAITRPFTEQDWTNPNGKDTSPYVLSKTLAERAAWDFVAQQPSGLELTTVLPAVVLGPVLDQDYGSSVELIRKLLTKGFPGCPRLGWPLVDVRDVAAMHILAMETPEAAGHRFLCANDFMWIADIVDVLKRHFPGYRRKIPHRKLPNWLVRFFALFDSAAGSVVFELDYKKEVSADNARRILGWQPRSNEEAIVSSANSLIALGIV